MRGFAEPEAVLPGVAACFIMLPGVADGMRAMPPEDAGVMLEDPLRRMPSFLPGCAEPPPPPPAAEVRLCACVGAGVAPATAAGRGVAKPPPAPLLPTAAGAVLGVAAAAPAAACAAGVAGVPAAAAAGGRGLLLEPLSASRRGPVPGADAGVAGTAACFGAADEGVAARLLLLAPLSMILGAAGVPVEGRGAALRAAPLSVKPPPGRGTLPEGLGRAAAADGWLAGLFCCPGAALTRCSAVPTELAPLLRWAGSACELVLLIVSLNRPPAELMAE